jgi:hypothetical protein
MALVATPARLKFLHVHDLMTDDMPLVYSLLSPVDAVNSIQTLKVSSLSLISANHPFRHNADDVVTTLKDTLSLMATAPGINRTVVAVSAALQTALSDVSTGTNAGRGGRYLNPAANGNAPLAIGLRNVMNMEESGLPQELWFVFFPIYSALQCLNAIYGANR